MKPTVLFASFLFLIGLNENLNAQFEGYYNELNWDIIMLNTGPNTLPPGVVFNSSDNSMTLTADGDFMGVSGTTMPAGIPFTCDWGDGLVMACIEIPSNGTIDFDWSYTMQIFFEDPANEPFGYCINDENFVSLVTPGMFSDQSGTESIEVTAGDTFCFVQASYFSEEFQAQTTVSNFSGPPAMTTTNLLEDCYAEENWTVTTTNSTGSATFGSNFISILSDSDNGGTNLDFLPCEAVDGLESVCINVPVSGEYSFNWSVDYPPLSNQLVDRFGYCLNGTAFELTSVNPMPFGTSSGTATVTVEAGDEFCFVFASKFSDSGIVTATINSFVLPDCLPVFSVTAEIEDILCNGDTNGSIDLTVIEAIGDVTYEWDSELAEGSNPTGLPAGTYCVEISDDEGNMLNECFEINEPEVLDVIINVFDVSCFGEMDGEASLTFTGGTPIYGVLWEDGSETFSIDELDGGDYEFTVTDGNGCIYEGIANIAEPSEIEIILDSTPSNDDDGTITVEIIGGDAPFQYSIDGINYQDANVFDELEAGPYDVTVIDDNGCFFTNTIDVPVFDNINELNEVVSFMLYPNPTSTSINIDLKLNQVKDVKIILSNALGETVLEKTITGVISISEPIEMSSFSPGIYSFSLIIEQNVLVKRLILD